MDVAASHRVLDPLPSVLRRTIRLEAGCPLQSLKSTAKSPISARHSSNESNTPMKLKFRKLTQPNWALEGAVDALDVVVVGITDVGKAVGA